MLRTNHILLIIYIIAETRDQYTNDNKKRMFSQAWLLYNYISIDKKRGINWKLLNYYISCVR